MKILIVDDSSTMRRIIGNVVMQLGFSKENFDEAEDGVKAWKLLSEAHYDVILTDWNMPNMNGLELVKKVKVRRNSSENSNYYDYNRRWKR